MGAGAGTKLVGCRITAGWDAVGQVSAGRRARPRLNGRGPRRALVRGCDRRRCDDDLGARVAGDLRGAANDSFGAFPSPLGGVEGYFLGHPSVLVERGPTNGPVGQV